MNKLPLDKTLFVSDLDGTLLSPSGALSHFARSELVSLIGCGLHFSCATSRTFNKVQELFEQVPLQQPVIVSNGSQLVDPQSGSLLSAAAIPPSVLPALFHLGARYSLPPFVISYLGARDILQHKLPANDGQRHFLEARRLDPRLRLVDEYEIVGQILALNFLGLRSQIDAIEANVKPNEWNVRFHKTIYIYNREFWQLEINSTDAGKGVMLRRLRKLVERQGLDKIVVFGDQENDFDLFDEADVAIAVANAQPAVKQRAHIVIGDNANDSVVTFLRACAWEGHRC